MKSAYYTLEYEWDRDDEIVTLEIGYSYSRPVPATYLSPPEGGIELDNIAAKKIVFLDDDGEELPRKATVEELTKAEQAFPADKAFDLACADWSDRDESARESAAEARAERLAEGEWR